MVMLRDGPVTEMSPMMKMKDEKPERRRRDEEGFGGDGGEREAPAEPEEARAA